MPIYEFESPAGERIERDFRIGECPSSIGEYRRIFSRVNFVCDGANSRWEDSDHRGAAIAEARRAAQAVKTDPEAYPITLGENAKTPEFVKQEFDWARKN